MNLPTLATARGQLDRLAPWLAPLSLRLLLAWEYFESGREKLHGQNWFADLHDAFPFPFDQLPSTLNWQLATWFELVGAACLLLGFGTRFAAASLLVLTVVATYAVHWPMQWDSLGDLAMGYAITDQGFGNFKLPVLFMAMLLPLIFSGAGRLSVDAWLARWSPSATPARPGFR
ncbi:HvfX family Cu-binding RiPP maturation protein [Stenotrophomonas maltophilia]|uniref:HvfX family Cu-binding RiPP maturation protein n=1 Tax=Stenotrophomonas maltophilia TaxID=40324 RepID=UPI000DA8EED4|nr:DoxX family protein [Stenotrophomonas maltophilia]PZS43027.1 DoxX family protein [Stenotrophomonas maltophilia]PZS63691.1 DoxX family protein [Stenotrophomonas maltophilia]